MPPAFTGFGLSDFRLLYNINYKDWLRDAENAYAILANLAENVSIVGHSTGANIAIFTAASHPIKHLILIAPQPVPLSNR